MLLYRFSNRKFTKRFLTEVNDDSLFFRQWLQFHIFCKNVMIVQICPCYPAVAVMDIQIRLLVVIFENRVRYCSVAVYDST